MKRLLYAFSLHALLIVTVLTACGGGDSSTPPPPPQSQAPVMGLMVPRAPQDLDGAFGFVASMPVSYYRPLAVYMDRPLACSECDRALAAGLKLVLEVRANGGEGVATQPVPESELPAFRSAVADAIAAYHPDVLVMEGEMNALLLYAGTPADYAAELQAGCEVAHASGVLCSDGGLVSSAVVALTVQWYLDHGRNSEALSLAQRALGVPGLVTVDDVKAALASRADDIARAHDMLMSFKAAGVDYLNFHWYVADIPALSECVAYLREAVPGVTVYTDEIGQWDDDPAETTGKLNTLRQLNIPIAIWFSGDSGQARSLADPTTWQLRSTGAAFKNTVSAWQ